MPKSLYPFQVICFSSFLLFPLVSFPLTFPSPRSYFFKVLSLLFSFQSPPLSVPPWLTLSFSLAMIDLSAHPVQRVVCGRLEVLHHLSNDITHQVTSKNSQGIPIYGSGQQALWFLFFLSFLFSYHEWLVVRKQDTSPSNFPSYKYNVFSFFLKLWKICGKENVAQSAKQNGLHYTSSAYYTGEITACLLSKASLDRIRTDEISSVQFSSYKYWAPGAKHGKHHIVSDKKYSIGEVSWIACILQIFSTIFFCASELQNNKKLYIPQQVFINHVLSQFLCFHICLLS